MKTPDEIKKDLIDCMEEAIEIGKTCDAKELLDFSHKAYVCMATTRAYIQQLEVGLDQWEDVASSPGAVEDMAIEINRLQAELAAVKRERDAAVKDLQSHMECTFCKHDGTEADIGPCKTCFHVGGGGFGKRNWQWRGVCPENTEGDRSIAEGGDE